MEDADFDSEGITAEDRGLAWFEASGRPRSLPMQVPWACVFAARSGLPRAFLCTSSAGRILLSRPFAAVAGRDGDDFHQQRCRDRWVSKDAAREEVGFARSRGADGAMQTDVTCDAMLASVVGMLAFLANGHAWHRVSNREGTSTSLTGRRLLPTAAPSVRRGLGRRDGVRVDGRAVPEHGRQAES